MNTIEIDDKKMSAFLGKQTKQVVSATDATVLLFVWVGGSDSWDPLMKGMVT